MRPRSGRWRSAGLLCSVSPGALGTPTAYFSRTVGRELGRLACAVLSTRCEMTGQPEDLISAVPVAVQRFVQQLLGLRRTVGDQALGYDRMWR